MTQEWDARIARLAGRQRTLVTHDQLLAIGCSRRTIAHWVNRRRAPCSSSRRAQRKKS
jgi:hypothetical protein